MFLFCHKNICCMYSLEVPHWGTSDECTQHVFSWRNKKNANWKKKKKITYLEFCYGKVSMLLLPLPSVLFVIIFNSWYAGGDIRDVKKWLFFFFFFFLYFSSTGSCAWHSCQSSPKKWIQIFQVEIKKDNHFFLLLAKTYVECTY